MKSTALIGALLGLALTGGAAPHASAQEGESAGLKGGLQNLTATAQGLFVTLDAGTPDNCRNNAHGWLFIPDAHRAMISLALYAYTRELAVVVHTAAGEGGGYCRITQFDLVK